MQPVIPTPSTVYQPNLAIELESFSALNNVRRSLGRSIATWFGSQTIERTLLVAPAQTITISDATSALLVVTSGPVTVTVTVNSVATAHAINSLFVYDVSATGFTVHNAGTDTVNILLRYLVT